MFIFTCIVQMRLSFVIKGILLTYLLLNALEMLNVVIIMSLIMSSSDEDIEGVPSMQSSYSAGMKRCGICMEERNPLSVHRSKSEETLCRLLITIMEETFDIKRSWVDHRKSIMNLKSGYVEGENSKWKAKQRKIIWGPILIRYQAQWERFLLEDLRDRGGMYGAIES